MSLLHPHADEIAQRYLRPDTIAGSLGSGIDGIVYQSSRNTAVKVHAQQAGFINEFRAYDRMLYQDVREVAGFTVPRLLGSDHDLWVLELSIVGPPCVIDFASVRIDQPPDFPAEAWTDWQQKIREEFGERWQEAANIYESLKRKCGIFYFDLSPRNVFFAADPTR